MRGPGCHAPAARGSTAWACEHGLAVRDGEGAGHGRPRMSQLCRRATQAQDLVQCEHWCACTDVQSTGSQSHLGCSAPAGARADLRGAAAAGAGRGAGRERAERQGAGCHGQARLGRGRGAAGAGGPGLPSALAAVCMPCMRGASEVAPCCSRAEMVHCLLLASPAR